MFMNRYVNLFCLSDNKKYIGYQAIGKNKVCIFVIMQNSLCCNSLFIKVLVCQVLLFSTFINKNDVVDYLPMVHSDLLCHISLEFSTGYTGMLR